MRKPRLLDLFCGAGGAAVGYHQAGFEVIGVDNRPQPNYPFEFHEADALEFSLEGFDVVHASPPCQGYSRTRKIIEGRGLVNHKGLDLVPQTRARIKHLPYIIENVPGAPLQDPLVLCGTMFGLRVYRHRLFESNLVFDASRLNHLRHQWSTGSHRGYSKGYPFVTVAGHNYNFKEGQRAMDVYWMAQPELSEAIPPAYTEWLGRQVIPQIQ